MQRLLCKIRCAVATGTDLPVGRAEGAGPRPTPQAGCTWRVPGSGAEPRPVTRACELARGRLLLAREGLDRVEARGRARRHEAEHDADGR